MSKSKIEIKLLNKAAELRDSGFSTTKLQELQSIANEWINIPKPLIARTEIRPGSTEDVTADNPYVTYYANVDYADPDERRKVILKVHVNCFKVTPEAQPAEAITVNPWKS